MDKKPGLTSNRHDLLLHAAILLTIHVAQLLAFWTIVLAAKEWWSGWWALLVIGVFIGLALDRKTLFWSLQVSQAALLLAAGLFIPTSGSWQGF